MVYKIKGSKKGICWKDQDRIVNEQFKYVGKKKRKNRGSL